MELRLIGQDEVCISSVLDRNYEMGQFPLVPLEQNSTWTLDLNGAATAFFAQSCKATLTSDLMKSIKYASNHTLTMSHLPLCLHSDFFNQLQKLLRKT